MIPEEKFNTLVNILRYTLRKGNARQKAQIREEIRCFNAYHKIVGPHELKVILKTGNRDAFSDWYKVYIQETHRGTGGGSRENGRKKNMTKQTDNRVEETKMTRTEKLLYLEALKEIEEKHGPLPKLKRRI